MERFNIVTAADNVCAAIYVLRQAIRANSACIEAVGDPKMREEAEDYAQLCGLALERLQEQLDTANNQIVKLLQG